MMTMMKKKMMIMIITLLTTTHVHLQTSSIMMHRHMLLRKLAQNSLLVRL